ncbi:MAG TPA: RimK family alpha-L-glutamate ligase [Lautropia sp.]|nr:RimK family alpha-L-glutamate ligase [Lautropia sp.]
MVVTRNASPEPGGGKAAASLVEAGSPGAPRGLSIAIMTDETGWHTSRLRRALRERGCTSRCVDLADCRFETTWGAHGLVVPGFGRGLPDAVIVRGIAGGSFEQVTLRLGILHALRECGIPVYNDARAIERSVDKAMTGFLLHRAGIATPATWTGESQVQARRRLMRETAAGREVVLKPLFGSQGRGLERLGEASQLPDLLAFGSVAHLQRFVPSAEEHGYDWRIMVIGGKVAAAMRRQGPTWIHNAAQGARCIGAAAPGPLERLAIRACTSLGLDYAGVDLIPDDESPEGALVLEVNGIAAWQNLQRVSGVDVASLLVDDLLLRKIPAAAAGRAA